MRVLHLLAPAPFGGLEQVVRSLAGKQAERHDVHVGAVLEPGVGEPPILSSLERRSVVVHRIRQPPRAYLRERAAVRELCRALAPDVVHTHGYHSDVLHTPVTRRLGIPTVSTVHGFTGGGLKNRFYEMLQRRAYRRCDGVVAVSHPLAGLLERSGVPADRLHVIPNAWTGGVDFAGREVAREALGLPSSGFIAGFIGRLSPEKGPDVFLEAVARLGSDVAAAVVGDGGARGALEEQARRLELGPSLRWLGVVEDAARFIRAFDVIVLSSRTEGTPIVLLEAMAAEVPVVATRVGGIPDVVSDAEARIVPPEDASALAGAIRDVADRPAAAARRATRAAERLRVELGPERWVERYDRVYGACGVEGSGRDG